MNDTLYIYLSADEAQSSFTQEYGPFLIKGTTPVMYNLYSINEDANPILHIFASFGDGITYADELELRNTIETANAIEIAKSGKPFSIAQNIAHTYVKQTSSYAASLTAMFITTYTNGAIGTHKVLLNHVKDSYYNSIKKINLHNTQIIPTTAHDVYAVASDAQGTVFNLYMSVDELPQKLVADNTYSTDYILSTRNNLPLTTRIFNFSLTPILSS